MTLQCDFATLWHLDPDDPDEVQTLVQTCLDTMFDPVLWKWALIFTLVCIVVGAAIGHVKGRWLAGLLWGAALGPIGWIVIALSRSKRQEPVQGSRREG
ncbi:MAG: hypothetical protein LBQ20_12635 [Rhodanobacter sp.]|jgi:hypothetical protein|nr:hypothetical protein [Rhodanobacter sp.]